MRWVEWRCGEKYETSDTKVEMTYFNPHFCISEMPTISMVISIEVFS
jgi:hypothetical protein